MTDDDRNVLKKVVKGDENWCFMYDQEAKCQSAAWLSPKKPKARKVKKQNSRVKSMPTALLCAKGIGCYRNCNNEKHELQRRRNLRAIISGRKGENVSRNAYP
jgi:hypothetical protein